MATANNNNVNEIVRQLAVVAQQLAARETGTNTDPTGELFKKIAQSKPPVYEGEPDPVKLENWLREFNKLLDVLII